MHRSVIQSAIPLQTLSPLLARRVLYHTDWDRGQFDARARVNLGWTLAHLAEMHE